MDAIFPGTQFVFLCLTIAFLGIHLSHRRSSGEWSFTSFMALLAAAISGAILMIIVFFSPTFDEQDRTETDAQSERIRK